MVIFNSESNETTVENSTLYRKHTQSPSPGVLLSCDVITSCFYPRRQRVDRDARARDTIDLQNLHLMHWGHDFDKSPPNFHSS